MVQLIQANGEAIVNTITPGVDDALKPYVDWFKCYSKAILGMPVEIGRAVCVLKDARDLIKAKIDEFETKIAKVTAVTERIHAEKKKIEERLEKLKDELINKGTEAIAVEFLKLANVNADPIMWKKLLTEPINEGDANAFFSGDPSGKGLLRIGDIEQRMLAEMKIQSTGRLDPSQYDVFRNAIVLAKLSLLDQNGLRELALKEQLGTTFFGPYLYTDELRYANNVLLGFARSIDGNDQWHVQSPPHPRVGGYDRTTFLQQRSDASRRYGYSNSGCDGNDGERTKGMRMWVDGDARAKLFKRIFTAPVVPGVELPSLLGSAFGPVLDSTYPWKLSAEEPWGQDGIEIDADNRGQNAIQHGQINGHGDEGLLVNIMIAGREPMRTGIGPTGIWQIESSIQDWRLDECFVVEYQRTSGELVRTYMQSFRNAFAGKTDHQIIERTVTVKPGDNLWSIARAQTGRGANYVAIYRVNRDQIKSPHLIYPGQFLRMPVEGAALR